MYLALWINDDRIVVCQPLLRRENAAVAVLRASRRTHCRGYVYSGEDEALHRMVLLLHRSQDSSLEERLKTAAQQADVSLVHALPAEPTRVLAAIKAPKPKLYPKHVNPKAKVIWDEMFEQYDKVIRRYKELKQQWIAALIIFQRLAGAQNISPFVANPAQQKLRNHMAREINKRANAGNLKALKIVDDTFRQLRRQGLAKAITDEQFHDAVNREQFYVTTRQRITPTRGTQPSAIINAALADGWGGQQSRYAFKAIDPYTSVLMQPANRVVDVILATSMTRDQITVLFELDESAKTADILAILRKAGRRWVRTGELVEIPRGATPRR